MGSVIDYIDCPYCHNEAYRDFYYKTGEDVVICSNCGYYHSYFRDNEKNEFVEISISNPYGYYHSHSENKFGYGGSLEKKEDLIGLIDAASNDENIKIIRLSQYIGGEIVTKIIYDKLKYQRMKKIESLNNI
jgi:uncharacterized Zn finger protein